MWIPKLGGCLQSVELLTYLPCRAFLPFALWLFLLFSVFVMFAYKKLEVMRPYM